MILTVFGWIVGLLPDWLLDYFNQDYYWHCD